jgi:KDO2-lipid IV(A) lauroyltransferase
VTVQPESTGRAQPTASSPAGRERRLEAPHRRGGSSPRIIERLALAGYRSTAWLLGHVPPRPAAAIVGRVFQASYLLWPTKRRWSNRNFGHVLGLPPDDARVRELAMRAYRGYGHYLVELMRLPSRPAEELVGLAPELDAPTVGTLASATPPDGGLILTVGHMGSNEAVAAAIAGHGLPISVVADDSAFPELFALLKRQREEWGVTIIAWRNLREIYGVLKRREMLGLLVDWGYRADGIPVRLFGAWTALPAGPATLAAKTHSRIQPIAIRRRPAGDYEVSWSASIDVPSIAPADLLRASQAMADALERAIAAAPDQWYSFKPIWPATADEAADLERRAGLMAQGIADPGPG